MTVMPYRYAKYAADAFNSRDLDALCALVAEDFMYLDGEGVQIGREPMRKREAALFAAFPDAQVTMTPFAVSAERLAVTAMLTGTFSAPLLLPHGQVPAHGEAVSVRYAAHFIFREGLAIREEVFFDSAALIASTERLAG